MECFAEGLRRVDDPVTARAWAMALALVILALPAAADGGPDFAWGPSKNGLRVGLVATAHADRLQGVTLQLSLENTTDGPLRLPGRLRLPWNWQFDFESDTGGPALVAHFAPPPEPPEPSPPIELVAGERFALRFDCRHWLQRESLTIARPRPGTHVVRAGSAPVGAEPDPSAWTGEVRSGDVSIEILFQDPPALPEPESEPPPNSKPPPPSESPPPPPALDEAGE